jgi:hypothetical protein
VGLHSWKGDDTIFVEFPINLPRPNVIAPGLKKMNFFDGNPIRRDRDLISHLKPGSQQKILPIFYSVTISNTSISATVKNLAPVKNWDPG